MFEKLWEKSVKIKSLVKKPTVIEDVKSQYQSASSCDYETTKPVYVSGYCGCEFESHLYSFFRQPEADPNWDFSDWDPNWDFFRLE